LLSAEFPVLRKIRSVLYVDDDPDICKIVGAALSLIAGFDVHIAGSGAAAIAASGRLMPDLVLMDVMMPGLDGPATLKRMRESATLAHIPVAFLTAKVLPEEIAHLLLLGAIGVIGKPFDPMTLGDEIFALWDSRAGPPEGINAQEVQAQVRAEVGSLSENFLEHARCEAARLRQMIERAPQGELSVLREIERLAHSIHGAGAMFGFREISAAAGLVEACANGTTEPALPQRLSYLTSQLERELEAGRAAAPAT
jgi:DNA-binding response OmpR family regulator